MVKKGLGLRMVTLFLVLQAVVLGTLASLELYDIVFWIMASVTIIQYLLVAFSDPGYYTPSIEDLDIESKKTSTPKQHPS